MGFLILSSILIWGYVIYGIGFYLDATKIRPKYAEDDFDRKEVVKLFLDENNGDITLTGAMFFNMGLGFFFAALIFFIRHSYKYGVLSLVPMLISFYSYRVWILGEYPRFLSILIDEIKKEQKESWKKV